MRLYYWFVWFTVRTLSTLLFGRRSSGHHNLPRESGALIASNHCSVADPPFVSVSIKRPVYFFAKAELFGHWWSPFLISGLNAFPVKRGRIDRKAYGQALSVLKEGNWLLLFPEGTRSRDGKLREGKPGVAKMAFDANVPIVPTCVTNSRHLKDAFFRRKRIRVKFGEPVYPSEFVDISSDKERYVAMTREVMRRIAELLRSFE